MYAQQDASSDHAKRLRKLGGGYIKKLRENAGMPQRELAEKVGLKYYTFVSQIESGQGRPPSYLYEDFARALGVPAPEFAKTMLMYYDPHAYSALFGAPSTRELKGHGR